MEEIIQEGSQPDPGVTPLKFDTVYARSLLQQYRICLWKFNITYWRTPNYNATRFSFSIAVALIFGACFWKLGGKTGNEQQVGAPKPSSCCKIMPSWYIARNGNKQWVGTLEPCHHVALQGWPRAAGRHSETIILMHLANE
jgi:hypothetical protein